MELFSNSNYAQATTTGNKNNMKRFKFSTTMYPDTLELRHKMQSFGTNNLSPITPLQSKIKTGHQMPTVGDIPFPEDEIKKVQEVVLLLKSEQSQAQNSAESQAVETHQIHPSQQEQRSSIEGMEEDALPSARRLSGPDPSGIRATSVDLVKKPLDKMQSDNNVTRNRLPESSISSIGAGSKLSSSKRPEPSMQLSKEDLPLNQIEPMIHCSDTKLSKDLKHVMNMPDRMFKLDDEDSVLEQHVQNEILTEYKLKMQSAGISPQLRPDASVEEIVHDQKVNHSRSTLVDVTKVDKQGPVKGNVISDNQSQKREIISSSGYCEIKSTLLNEESSLNQHHPTSSQGKENRNGQHTVVAMEKVSSSLMPVGRVSRDQGLINISVSASSSQITEAGRSLISKPQFRDQQSRTNTAECSKEDISVIGAAAQLLQDQKERGKSANTTTMVIDVRVNQDGSHQTASKDGGGQSRRVCINRTQTEQSLSQTFVKSSIKGRYNADRSMLMMNASQELSAGKQYQTAIIGGGFRPQTRGSDHLQLGVHTLSKPRPDVMKGRSIDHSGQKQPQYFAGFTQNVQGNMLRDEYSNFTNTKPSDKGLYLGSCIDMRSTTNKSIQKHLDKQQLLYSNARIPVYETADAQNKDCKKQQKNRKTFLLYFNDINKQQRDAGKGMAILGNNYTTNVGGRTSVQHLQRKLTEKRDMMSRTSYGKEQTVMVNYNTYINDSSQIQLSQQSVFNKKPTTASIESRNPMIQMPQMAKTHGNNTLKNWASMPEPDDPAKVTQSSLMNTKPSNHSFQASMTDTEVKNIRFNKSRLNPRKHRVGLKRVLDQSLVMASQGQEQIDRSSRCFSAESMYDHKKTEGKNEHKLPITKIVPAFLASSFTMQGFARPDFALGPSSTKRGSAFRVNQNTTFGRSRKFSKTRQLGTANERNSSAMDLKKSPNRTSSTGLNTSAQADNTILLSSTMTNIADTQQTIMVPQRLTNYQMLYSRPQEGFDDDLMSVMPGKRILSKAQPSVFSTMLGSTVGGQDAGLGSLESLKQICSITASVHDL